MSDTDTTPDFEDAELEEDPEMAEDFTPVDPAERALGSVLHGLTWQEVAGAIGLSVAEVVALVDGAARQEALPWSPGLTRDIVHATLTSVTRRVHDALADETDADTVATLLRLLLDVTRLRGEVVGILPVVGVTAAEGVR